MNDLIVSLSKNALKVTLVDQNGLAKIEKEVTEDICKDTQIVNVESFTALLDQVISEVSSQQNKKLRLNFVAEPQDVLFKFIFFVQQDCPLCLPVYWHEKGNFREVSGGFKSFRD